MPLIEVALLLSIALWFAFFVVNHADLTAKVRAGLMPALPKWLGTLIACPLCASFWTLAAFSLFTGYTPLMWICPVMVLFIDLTYQRLIGKGAE